MVALGGQLAGLAIQSEAEALEACASRNWKLRTVLRRSGAQQAAGAVDEKHAESTEMASD